MSKGSTPRHNPKKYGEGFDRINWTSKEFVPCEPTPLMQAVYKDKNGKIGKSPFIESEAHLPAGAELLHIETNKYSTNATIKIG